MKIKLQLFGAYRQFGEQLDLTLPNDAIVSDIRAVLFDELKQLSNGFNNSELLESSRFATETQILSEDIVLKNGEVIAIIPPVAGG